MDNKINNYQNGRYDVHHFELLYVDSFKIKKIVIVKIYVNCVKLNPVLSYFK